jgi:hypothetical protein
MKKIYGFLIVIALIMSSGSTSADSASYIKINFDETLISEMKTVKHLDWEYPVVKRPLKNSQEFVFRLEFEDKECKRNKLIVVVFLTGLDNPLQNYLIIVDTLIKAGWDLVIEPEMEETPVWTFAFLDLVLNSIQITSDTINERKVLFESDKFPDKRWMMKSFLENIKKL